MTRMNTKAKIMGSNSRMARMLWNDPSTVAIEALAELSKTHGLSVASGDLSLLEGRWYVTHTGLLGVARRKRCFGIHVQAVPKFCDSTARRWTFRATVYKHCACRGFVGYGDAEPTNVSPLVVGAEMRIAETRAVNRALRKAYGIGMCSFEEMASASHAAQPRAPASRCS